MSHIQSSFFESEKSPIVFYRAEVRFRNRKMAENFLLWLGIAVGTGYWCALKYNHGRPDSPVFGFVAVASIVGSIMALILLWKALINATLVAQIDERGIHIDGLHWDWATIAALGAIHPVVFGSDFTLQFYAEKLTKAGRIIPLDRAFGEDDYRAFLDSIRPFLNQVHPHVSVPTLLHM